MNTSRFLVIFSAGFVLSACATSSFPPMPADSPKQIDRAVMDAVKQGEVIQQSVLRDEGKVSLAVRLPESWGGAKGDVYIQANCATAGADWIYADLAEKKSPSGKKERRYGNGSSAYSPPLVLGEAAAAAVHRLPEVQQACERTPSWREVVYNKKSDTQIILEVSSLQPLPEGGVRFWAAVDYPHVAQIRLFKAPYARRAGLYHVDCQKQVYSLHYVYYLDQQQTITDGGMATRAPQLSIAQASGDSAALLSTVCGQGPEELAKTLVPPDLREKRLPDFASLHEADTGVADQLAKLRQPAPKRSLDALRVEGTRIPKSGSAAARLSRAGSFQQEVLIGKTAIPGVFRIDRQEGEDRVEQMSFLGLIPISQTLNNSESRNISRADRLELRGDWSKMAVGSQLGYWMRTRIVDLVTNQFSREEETICKITRELPAESLNPQFQGKAKELKCHNIGDKDDEISTYHYLEDYGFALQQGSTSGKYSLNSRVVEVR